MKHAIKFGRPNDTGKHILANAHIDNYPVERQGIILTAQVLCSHVAEVDREIHVHQRISFTTETRQPTQNSSCMELMQKRSVSRD